MIDPQLVPGPTLYVALVSALTTVQSADGSEMRANLLAFMIRGLIMSLIGLVAIGHITRDQVEMSLLRWSGRILRADSLDAVFGD